MVTKMSSKMTTQKLKQKTVEALRAKGVEGQTIDSIVNMLLNAATKGKIVADLKVSGVKDFVLDVISEYMTSVETRLLELESIYRDIVVPKATAERHRKAFEQQALCVCPDPNHDFEIETDQPCEELVCPDHGMPLVAPQISEKKKKMELGVEESKTMNFGGKSFQDNPEWSEEERAMRLKEYYTSLRQNGVYENDDE